jgi:acyl carrier protein
MPSDPVSASVAELIEQVTDVPAREIHAGTRFEELGSWSSFAALRLLVAIEEGFDVHLDLRAYYACSRVGELCAIVAAELAQGSGSLR